MLSDIFNCVSTLLLTAQKRAEIVIDYADTVSA